MGNMHAPVSQLLLWALALIPYLATFAAASASGPGTVIGRHQAIGRNAHLCRTSWTSDRDG